MALTFQSRSVQMIMSRGLRPTIAYVAVGALGLAVGGCDLPTEPQMRPGPADPADIGPAMALSRREVASITVPSPSQSGAPYLGDNVTVISWGPSAGVVTEWLPVYTTSGESNPVEVVAQGAVQITLAPWGAVCAISYCPYLPAWGVALNGVRAGPLGIGIPFQLHRPLALQLRFRSVSGGITYFGFYGYDGAEEASAYLPDLGAGTLEVGRVPFHCLTDGASCFTFTGVQTLTVNVLEQQQEELVLECGGGATAAVLRGEPIGCALRTDPPGGQIDVEQWWFIGTDSRGQEYRYDRQDVPTASWSGEMALSGVVHVRASVNGAAPIEKSAAVTVTNRPWDDQTIEYHVQRVGLEDFPEHRRPPLPPENVRDLGRTYMEGTHLSRSEPGVIKFIQDDGPNSLLAYLDRIPLEAVAFVLVSPAMAEGSDFYRAQRVNPPAFSDRPACLQRDFDRYVSLILQHEGYPPNAESHTGVFINELTPRARVVEDVVGPNDALHELQTIWQKRLEDAASQALAQAADPVDDRFPIPFGCEFNFRVGR